jgi:two-component system NtrC family sensor kinase
MPTTGDWPTFIHSIPPVCGVGVMFLLASISFLRGRRNPTNLLFSVICLMGGIINADVALVSLIPDKSIALGIDRWTYFFFVFSIPVFIQFVHGFLGLKRRGWMVALAYAAAFLFLPFVHTPYFISGFHTYSFGTIAKAGPVYHLFSGVVGLTMTYCLLVLANAVKRTPDPAQRNRIRYILFGMGFSALLISLNILPVSGIDIYPLGNFSFIPAIVLAFGVLKYDLLDIGVLIRKGTIYFLLTGVLTLVYIAAIYLFHLVFIDAAGGRSILLPMVLALIIVLLFNPLKGRIQDLIDHVFFRAKYDYQELLRTVSGELAGLLKYEQIERLLLTTMVDALQVTQAGVAVQRPDADRLALSFHDGRDFRRGEELSITPEHPLIQWMTRTGKPVVRSQVSRLDMPAVERKRVESVMQSLDAAILIPLLSGKRPIGFFFMSEKRSGELFVHEDLELLTTLANQSVTAIENAQTYEALEALNRELEKKVEARTLALKNALEERERTQQQLIQSESLAAIGQLVAGTAHELNNPLAGATSLIQSSLESIQQDLTPSEKDELIDDMKFVLKELQRAAAIVRSLLGLSRQTQTYMEPVNMNLVLDDALRILYNQYKHLEVEIVKHYQEDLPEVNGNFANLGQVFINILKNALQSLPEGKGSLVLETGYRTDRDIVWITCRDSGQGIPPDRLKDIFKPFFTTKEVGKGTGLGLYISHEIIQRHGGSISAQSVPGEGTTMTVTLPRRGRMG